MEYYVLIIQYIWFAFVLKFFFNRIYKNVFQKNAYINTETFSLVQSRSSAYDFTSEIRLKKKNFFFEVSTW